MSSKKEMEIQKMEQAGMSVVSIDSKGKLEYATDRNEGDEYCDLCESLRFESDPDPYDWFRDTDRKAICAELNVRISGRLTVWELANIPKPLYCPKLGRELTEEEKKLAKSNLEFARKYR